MTGGHMFPRNTIVKFFAAEVSDSIEAPPHLNDNCCPHCGGVLAPGDRASDCSSLQFRSRIMPANCGSPAETRNLTRTS